MKHARTRTGTLTKGRNQRKARFLAALRIAGLSMADWAKENGTTQSHVSHLLVGRRVHEQLNKKIDAFADKHLAKAAA